MRDYVLTALVGALLISVFRHPVIGAYLWAWLSLMNPHKMTWGFAFRLPFAQAAAIVTLLALMLSKSKRQPLPVNKIVVVQIMLLVWMGITSLFAVAPADTVLERWIFVLKIQGMLLVTWMLVCTPAQIRVLIWVVTMSVAFFGIKGGIWTMLTGGGGRVWGPPGGMLEDNNQLAVGLVMLLPMMFYLHQTETRRWLRIALAGAMVACAFSILGSQSRGALVGLLAMAFFLGIKGRHPVRTSLLLLMLVVLAISFMPDSWTSRMDTIRSYQEDGSAMSRIWTWKTMWAAAVDRPLVGVGFLADNPTVFARYSPKEAAYEVFQGRVYVAHSIYFQVLGEHGFVGLALFLLLGLLTWTTASRVARQMRNDEVYGAWLPQLMRMVQVSLIGYGTGGAFLSLAYLDLPYYIMGFVVLGDGLARRRMIERSRLAMVDPARTGVQAPAPDAVKRRLAGPARGVRW